MWINPKDLLPQGEPETVVILPTGSILGLSILGLAKPLMLGIREDRDGYPQSCAISLELHIEPAPVQRNPNRSGETGEE